MLCLRPSPFCVPSFSGILSGFLAPLPGQRARVTFCNCHPTCSYHGLHTTCTRAFQLHPSRRLCPFYLFLYLCLYPSGRHLWQRLRGLWICRARICNPFLYYNTLAQNTHRAFSSFQHLTYPCLPPLLGSALGLAFGLALGLAGAAGDAVPLSVRERAMRLRSSRATLMLRFTDCSRNLSDRSG